ncbi:hypothetical protein K1719_047182 [Acacia pycnantha]|nr:hypothetical protein K1719_047182 [Acacia pycnantha]
MEPFPLRPSKFSFEYLLLPPRSAPTAAPPWLAPQVLRRPPRPPTHRGLALAPTAGIGRALQRHPFSGLVDSAVSLRASTRVSSGFARSGIVHHLSGPVRYALTRTLHVRSRSVGGATHEGSRRRLPCALRVYSPVDSHTCRLLGPCFKTGRMGAHSPTPERAVPRHAVTARAASHDRGDDVSAGISTARAWAAAAIRVGPRPESIGGPALTVPHPTGAHRQPHPLPSRQFQALFDSLFKVLFIFPSRYLFAIGLSPHLALDGIYRPIGAAFPNNPTRRQRLVVRQGSGTTGLSPSPAPLSGGLGPGPPPRTLLRTTIRTPGDRFSWWAVPGSLAVTRESSLVSFPPLIDMLKLSG